MRQIAARSFPKAMPKINFKINTTKNAFESDSGTKLLQKSSGTNYSQIMFLKIFWNPSSRPFQDAPWTSQIITKSRKNLDFSLAQTLPSDASASASASGC